MFDIASCAVGGDLDNLSLNTFGAMLLGNLTHKFSVEAGIHMVGIVETIGLKDGKFIGFGGH